MKITINNPKVSCVLLNGIFYDANKEIDIDFSEAMRLSRIANVDLGFENHPYDPAIFKEDKRFAFISEIDGVSGWGNVSHNLIRFSSPPYNISQIGRMMDVRDPAVLQASKNPLQPEMAVVIHEQPKSYWINSNFQKRLAIVPFETTVIPASWIPRINVCDVLMVPCKQNIEAYKNSGVKIPIELIHWGIDPNKFSELKRTEGRTFTFGTMGALSNRKGTDILVKAFEKAFPNGEDVQLICKTSFNQYHFMSKDKRIKVDMTPVPHDELIENFFQKVDCFVFPTRGEGFGLTPLEAMATGIPAIVTGWSGPLEYMVPDVGWLIDHTMVDATDFSNVVYKENCGQWAEPSLDHLVELMRYAYEHQDEVKQKGANAAQYVRDNWLWSDKIKMFHNVIEKYL